MATTSTFNQIIEVGPSNLYVVRSSSIGGRSVAYIGKWNGTANTISAVGNGVNALTLAVCNGASDGQIYLSGTFTQTVDGLSTNKVAYYNGSSWSNLGLTSGQRFSEDVTALAYDSTNNVLYVGSHGSTTTSLRISSYNGSIWTYLSSSFTVNNYLKFALDSNNNLYAAYNSVLKKFTRSNSTWSDISTNVGSTVNDLRYDPVNNRVYMALSSGAVKYYDVTNNNIVTLTSVSGTNYAVTIDESGGLYIANWPSSGYLSSVVKYNFGNSTWQNLYNHMNTSGVLSLVVDKNENLYCFGNSGGLIVGIYPYANGNWQNFSSTTTVSYGGTVFQPSPSGSTYNEIGSGGCYASGTHSINIYYNVATGGSSLTSGLANICKNTTHSPSGGSIMAGNYTGMSIINPFNSSGAICNGLILINETINYISSGKSLLGGGFTVSVSTTYLPTGLSTLSGTKSMFVNSMLDGEGGAYCESSAIYVYYRASIQLDLSQLLGLSGVSLVDSWTPHFTCELPLPFRVGASYPTNSPLIVGLTSGQ